MDLDDDVDEINLRDEERKSVGTPFKKQPLVNTYIKEHFWPFEFVKTL